MAAIYDNGIDDADDTTTQMTMEEFDEYKASCLYLIDLAKDAAKLVEFGPFQKIIMENYFTHEPQRLGSLMASGKLTDHGFDGCVGDLKAIGHLRSYLQDFIQKGNIAADELKGLEEARAEAVAS